MNAVVQGLWIGNSLSVLEQLSIQSFLSNGHNYHLYTYGDVEQIPVGTRVLDANRILPESQIFTYQQGAGKGSFAGFANFFRYQLLLQTGGWWVDTDLICLKPFDFQTEYVFASEWTTDIPASSMATNSVIKAPQASDFAQYCWQACQAQDIGQLAWGVTGPALAQQAIADLQLQAYVQPPDLFCPILYTHILDLIDPHKNPESILESSYAIHLWNEMWRRHGIDKNQSFDSHCLYEQLKSRYQIGQSSGLPRESSK